MSYQRIMFGAWKSCLLFMLCFVSPVWGEESLRLWKDQTPGALGNQDHDHPTLTLYFPKKDVATGAAIVICPGGGYGGLAPHEGKGYAEWLAEHGIAGLVLKYRLGSKGYRHPIMLGDAARAVRLAKYHAREWGIDPERIGIMGSSAGGHLAAMALSTDWPAFDPELPAALLAGGCSISGVYDLEAIRLSYHNKILHIAAEEAVPWSPLHCLPPAAPPLLLAVGSEETSEFLRQHAEYAAAWQARGLALEEVDMAGLHHFTAVDALADREHALHTAVQHMLRPGLP